VTNAGIQQDMDNLAVPEPDIGGEMPMWQTPPEAGAVAGNAPAAAPPTASSAGI
jgi:hypothetical protein